MNIADTVSPEDGLTGFLRPFESEPRLHPGPALPGAATTVAVHPKGKLVAWGTNSSHIVVSRGSTDEIVRTISTSAPLSRVAFAADGSVLFATTQDARLTAYDPEMGGLLATTRATVGGPWELAVDPLGRYIAVGGWTNVVRLFDPRELRAIGDLAGHSDGVTALAFSPKATLLAAGCADGSVSIWDPVARQELRRIPGAGGPAYAVAWGADETTLAVGGGGDRTVRVYDALKLRLKATYRGHESSVRSLVFALGEERLLSGGQDGSIRMWDATKDVRGRLIPFSGSLNDAAFQSTRYGLGVVAAATEEQVKTWSAFNGRLVAQATPPLTRRQSYPRRYTVFLNGGQQLAGLAKDDPNAVTVFDSTTGERRARLFAGAGTGPVQILGSDHARNLVVWATPADDNLDIRWRDPKTDVQPGAIRFTARSLVALTIDPASKQIAVLTAAPRPGGDRVLWVLDITGTRAPREITRSTSSFGGLAFNAEGTRLAVSLNDAIEIYRTDTWELCQRMPLAPSTCLAFSPDGRRLAAIGYDGHATLFDPNAGKRVFTLRSLAPGRRDDMAADSRVAFSPDGLWLLSTNWDGSLNVWDGQPVRE
jgi:WD40 repeat protein